MIVFYDHQKKELEETSQLNKVAYFHDMGLGKTFTGAEKLKQLGSSNNLVVCQKSKIEDWINHFKTYYPEYHVFNLSLRKEFNEFEIFKGKYVAIINYDLIFRRKSLLQMKDFTLLLDESSMIQNENAKRSKFILSLKPSNIILLSGTPTGGKYEKLWSQLHLLGWKISKSLFYRQYVDYHYDDKEGFPIMIIDGYKNENRLKEKMKQYGCRFLKTEDVFDLPGKIDQNIFIAPTKEYKDFHKNSIVEFNGIELIGSTTLTKMLRERQLCGQYNQDKLDAVHDLVASTEDRIIIFYNFNDELNALQGVAEQLSRPVAVVNGERKDLEPFIRYSNSVALIQYQAGAMGLNLQFANRIIYFTPPLSSELFEQSKKRIHRIGQSKTCFYYYLRCSNTIEDKIYDTLARRKDYTEYLFQKENCTNE